MLTIHKGERETVIRRTDKIMATKYYTENKRMSNTNLTKNRVNYVDQEE
jgi:hypothetical protein